jgi:hypothetical protein
MKGRRRVVSKSTLSSTAPRYATVRRLADLTLRRTQSAMTNGRILKNCDHRKPWVRRLKDCIAATINDAGGIDNVSHAERVLIHRSSLLTVQLELIEQSLGQQDGRLSSEQMTDYLRGLNSLRRLFETLSVGLPRRPRDVTPTVETYLAASDAAE